MEAINREFRFNLRAWLMNLSVKKRQDAIQAIILKSGQSIHTLRRIMYMRPDDNTYVRQETKQAICSVLNKSLQELENEPKP
ncbi:hypothetical protein [Rurimicrobium arvi]|uniref:Uncharacterized protein n=1 Tax=Rurimicrobium arvi TaxID=2049916 RepID=A0ABP8MX83_9BACT